MLVFSPRPWTPVKVILEKEEVWILVWGNEIWSNHKDSTALLPRIYIYKTESAAKNAAKKLNPPSPK